MKRSERRPGCRNWNSSLQNTGMAGTRIENGRLQNISSGYTVGAEGLQVKPGRPRKNWMDIIRRDLKDMDTIVGMKPKNWRQTEQNGVNVWWPNDSMTMWVVLRSKVR